MLERLVYSQCVRAFRFLLLKGILKCFQFCGKSILQTISLEAHVLFIFTIKMKIQTENQESTASDVLVAQKCFQSIFWCSLQRDDKSLYSPKNRWWFRSLSRFLKFPFSDKSCRVAGFSPKPVTVAANHCDNSFASLNNFPLTCNCLISDLHVGLRLPH